MSYLRAAIEALETRYLDDDGDGYGGIPFVHLPSVLALIPPGSVIVTAETLGYAMDRQDEIDARIGVVGQGRKAERILARLKEMSR